MKKIILGILVGIILITFCIYFSIFIYQKNLNLTFIVNKGETVYSISNNLKNKGIISSSFLFKNYFNSVTDIAIKSGKYTFLGSYNIPKVVKLLTNSSAESLLKTKKLTIPEGFNKYDVSEYLSKNTNYKYEDILNFIDNNYKNSVLINKYPFISSDYVFNLEGYLYPDTYEIYENATIESIFSKMLNDFNTKVVEKYNITDYKKLYEIIKMASVIEKEVKLDQDRPIVASVINNRIAKNMRLQMDSTVVYFTKNRDNMAIAEDKWTENDYNTYRKLGLPVGPISNPGDKSINAAINPSVTDYYYFVNKSDGEAVFSKTLEEHNMNVRKYLW